MVKREGEFFDDTGVINKIVLEVNWFIFCDTWFGVRVQMIQTRHKQALSG